MSATPTTGKRRERDDEEVPTGVHPLRKLVPKGVFEFLVSRGVDPNLTIDTDASTMTGDDVDREDAARQYRRDVALAEAGLGEKVWNDNRTAQQEMLWDDEEAFLTTPVGADRLVRYNAENWNGFIEHVLDKDTPGAREVEDEDYENSEELEMSRPLLWKSPFEQLLHAGVSREVANSALVQRSYKEALERYREKRAWLRKAREAYRDYEDAYEAHGDKEVMDYHAGVAREAEERAGDLARPFYFPHKNL